mmetsp:Transcript_40498/g.68840  ORF Transcript_40498/g.68840 Transcript_40498/m.68840 type:complete len:95 (+) Transcript_40498:45-329(+)
MFQSQLSIFVLLAIKATKWEWGVRGTSEKAFNALEKDQPVPRPSKIRQEKQIKSNRSRAENAKRAKRKKKKKKKQLFKEAFTRHQSLSPTLERL